EPHRLESERGPDRERRAEGRVAREWQLAERSEDPDPGVPALPGWEDEHRLGEVHLAREPLHRPGVEPAPVGEDSELVALQRRTGEDVEQHIGDVALRGLDPGDVLGEGHGEAIEVGAHRTGTYRRGAA